MKRYQILLLLNLSAAYQREIIAGIAKYSHLYGPWSFFSEMAKQKMSVMEIEDLSPDGIFIQARKAKELDEILPKGIPAIVMAGNSGPIEGVPNIVDDWQGEGNMAATHFLERGFRNFGFCGFRRCEWSVVMHKCFSAKLAKKGLKISEFNTPHRKCNSKDFQYLKEWIESLSKPVGIFACDDHRATDVLKACQAIDCPVPEQVAIMGVDNDPIICELADPPLSSIALNIFAAGYKAAKLMDKMIRGGEHLTENIIVEATHVERRRSTDTLATDDPDTTKAIYYIKSNAKRQITVAEVAENIAVSRRSLERKFRKHLNTSITQIIKKERIAKVSRLLEETKVPVAQIVEELNIHSHKHLAEYFKKETGMTPTAYRKKFRKL